MTEFIEKDKVLEFLNKKAEKRSFTAVFYVVVLLVFMILLFALVFPFFLIEALLQELFSKKELNNENIQ